MRAYSYDDWLEQSIIDNQPCEPKVVDVYVEYEGIIDGKMEVTHDPIYNCYECSNKECGYWKEYNDGM